VLNCDGVIAGRQVGYDIEAFFIRHRRAGDLRGLVGDDHGHARQDGIRCILDCPADAAGDGLPIHNDHAEHQCNEAGIE
jgi:hypothetical protein